MLSSESAVDLLFELNHADIPFGLVVCEGYFLMACEKRNGYQVTQRVCSEQEGRGKGDRFRRQAFCETVQIA
jgi:hypothetical protein